mgnify:FL=1
MKKHTLLIHHFEETWRDGLSRYGMTPEVMAHNIIDFLHSPKGRGINDVILTTWEMPGPCEVQTPVLEYLKARGIPFEHHVFGYGEERSMYDGMDCTLVQATRYGDDPNQVVCIEDWHRALAKSASVSLCGAFEGECIQDAEDMLMHVRGEHGYNKLTDLIVGTHETYWRKLDVEAAFVNARSLIEEFEEKYAEAVDLSEEEQLVTLFKKKLNKLTKDAAFQVLALCPSEDVGYLYSETEALDDALTEVVQAVDIKKNPRALELDTALSF